jgi:hypothetical protein
MGGGPSSRADDHHVHQRQLATSNETLNMFLGGRQPAWLTATPDASAPAPAPTALNARRQTQPLNSHPSTAPVLPSPSPSDDSVLESNPATAAEIARADPALYTLPHQPTYGQAAHSRKRSIDSSSMAALKRTRVGDNSPQEPNMSRTERPQVASAIADHYSIRWQPNVESNMIQNQAQARELPRPQCISPSQSPTAFEPPQCQPPAAREGRIFREELRPSMSSLQQAQLSHSVQRRQSYIQNSPVASPNLAQSRVAPPAVPGRQPSSNPQMRPPDQILTTNGSFHQAVLTQHTLPPSSGVHSIHQNYVTPYQHQNQTTTSMGTGNSRGNTSQALPSDIAFQRAGREAQHSLHQLRAMQQTQQMQQNSVTLEQPSVHSSGSASQIPTNMPPPPQQGETLSNLPYHKTVCMPKYLAYRAAHPEPLSMISDSRMTVLREAVESNDAAFLFMHQILCIQSVNPHIVPQPLKTLPTFDAAIRYLDTILAFNSQLDPELVKWFAEFPMPLAEVAMNWSQTYHLGMQATAALFWRFGMYWTQFQNDCKTRNYPPVASELNTCLGVESPALMHILFTAILRSIWGSKDERNTTYPRVEQAFLANRDWYMGRRAQGLISNQERSHVDKQCLAQYNQLYSQLRQSERPNMQTNSVAKNTPAIRRQMPGATPDTTSQSNPYNQEINDRSINRRTTTTQKQSQPHGGIRHPPTPPSTQARAPAARLPPQGLFYPAPLLSSMPQRQAQLQRPSTTSLSRSPFLPVADAPGPSMPANPTWQHSALHQSHLRSPVLCQDDVFAIGPNAVLYQYVKEFALEPKRLNLGSLVHERRFNVSANTMAQVPQTRKSIPGQPPTRHLTERSLQFRLRCSKGARANAPIEEKNWVISDTCWPGYVYLTFNSTLLEIRRKLHFGKDLPIDLTEFVVEGENTIQIALNTDPGNEEIDLYAFAVEVIGIKNLDAITGECDARYKPADEVLASIKSSLNDSPADDDDDIVMVSENVTINLFDPISLKQMCDTPVRSKHCVHRHCFDLGTFLEGRSRAKPNYPSMVDVWRCPICREDARPHNLLIDGFLVSVQKELREKGDRETRAIIVQRDGSWTPRPEKKSNHGSSKSTPSRAASVPGPPGRSIAVSPVQTPVVPTLGSVPIREFPFQSTHTLLNQVPPAPSKTSSVTTVVALDSESE